MLQGINNEEIKRLVNIYGKIKKLGGGEHSAD